MKKAIKKLLNKPIFIKFFNLLHVKTKGLKNNVLKLNSSVRGKCTVDISNNAVNNDILIDNNNLIKNLTIKIFGSNNKIVIEKDCYIDNLTIWLEDDNNTVFIGKSTQLCGQIKLSCIEGTQISVGENSLFSSEIDIRTGDGHALLDESGKRINPSKDVLIDEHVWVGYRVIMLKGAHVHKNSVVGANLTVTNDISEESVAIAGTPAKIVKRNINWNFDRNFSGGYNNN